MWLWRKPTALGEAWACAVGWGGLELVDEGLPFFVEDEQQEVGDQQ